MKNRPSFIFRLPAKYDLLKTAVEEYRPNVVIDEVGERFLLEEPNNHPEWEAARERYNSRKMARH